MRAELAMRERGPYARYDLVTTPDTIDGALMMFHEMMREHLQVLANDVNALIRWVAEIKAWAVVLSTCSDYERFFLHTVQLAPLITSAVSQPYVLKQRFAFCASHTTHQANAFVRADWSEEQLPADDRIGVNTLPPLAKGWTAWPKFEQALADIDSADYRERTGQYRSRFQHRIPQRFGYGHTNIIQREIKEVPGGREYSYGFGGIEPMQPEDVVDAIDAQAAYAIKALAAYADLLKEQFDRLAAAVAPRL